MVEPRQKRSWSFAEDIVPILTRLGCNTGGCHGKADGQNGFHLSLADMIRRAITSALARDRARGGLHDCPEQSLFLTKATGRTPTAEAPA